MKSQKNKPTATSVNEQRRQALSQVKAILAATAVPFPSPFFASPRAYRAALWAAPAAVTGFLLSYLVVGLLVAAVVFMVIWKITPAETWNERFSNILTAYGPADEAAYQSLLAKIKANTACRDDILAWLNVELPHVERPGEVAAEKALLDNRLH